MARMTTVVASCLLALIIPSSASSTSDVSKDGYSGALKSTMADNRAQDAANISIAYNILCTFSPADQATYPPAFHAAGSGALEGSAGPLVVKGSDSASFGATCYSPDFDGEFTLNVAYRFQYFDQEKRWVDIGSAFSCSAGSEALGVEETAHVQIPGTIGCGFNQLYGEGDPSLSRPHRLQVQLSVSLPNGTLGPRIKGWSLPWQMSSVAS